MITFRPFRNNDPPQIAEIWRGQHASRGVVQPMTTMLLEKHVFNSPLFDREGFIVATANSRLLGFAHAGFGPTADGAAISTQLGGVLALMVRQGESSSTLADDLLAQGEQYVQRCGATTLAAGGIDRLGPFYLGLLGGSSGAVILASDRQQQQFYLGHGYREVDRSVVLQLELARFRAPVDRRQIQARRRTQFEVVLDPPTTNWWEAVNTANIERARYDLISKDNGTCLASVSMWNMDLLGATWGMRAAGLFGLEVMLDCNKRQGLAMLLISEALRHLQSTGVMLVEVHVLESNVPARTLFERLGFTMVDHAVRYRKEVVSIDT